MSVREKAVMIMMGEKSVTNQSTPQFVSRNRFKKTGKILFLTPLRQFHLLILLLKTQRDMPSHKKSFFFCLISNSLSASTF